MLQETCSDRNQLQRLSCDIAPEGSVARAAIESLEKSLPSWRTIREFADFGRPLTSRLQEAYRSTAPVMTESQFNRAFIASLASSLPERIASRKVPDVVAREIPAALKRLGQFLAADVDESYSRGSDYFLKDFRFTAGLTVPAARRSWTSGARLIAAQMSR
jgi:hypothetical protein